MLCEGALVVPCERCGSFLVPLQKEGYVYLL